MGVLAWIVVGLVAGWLADKLTGRDHGLVKSLLVGIVGALVGSSLFSSLLGSSYYRGVNLATILRRNRRCGGVSLHSGLAARARPATRSPPLGRDERSSACGG